MKRASILGIVLVCLSIVFVSCGGGGDGEDKKANYDVYMNLAASVGDLLTYSLNSSTLAYSYQIVDSDFGLQGYGGSGTLQLNQDGTYTPSSNPSARVILLKNTSGNIIFLVGSDDLTVNNQTTTMVYAGVPALSTNYTLQEISGVYNYISYECSDPLQNGVCQSGYASYYGTFKVNDNGTWQACDSGDIDNQTAHPCNGTVTSGQFQDNGNGTLTATSSGLTIATAMVLPSSSGENILVIDLKDRPAAGAGPGIMLGVKKQDISQDNLTGVYHYIDSSGGYGSVIVFDNDTFQYGTTTGTFQRNDPWTGWIHTTDSNSSESYVLILPSEGVFLQTGVTSNDWIGIGGAP
jgi:hypothetical protein